MGEKHFDWSVFTHPRILYTELALSIAAGATPRLTTNFNDLKCSRDLLVDYIYIGDDGTFSSSPATPNQSNLQGLNINWQIADRAPYFPQGLVPVMTMHNWWDCDRTQSYGPAQNPDVTFLNPIGSLYWRHTLRWVYNPSQSFQVDWQKVGNNAAPPGAMPAVNLNVYMYGVGLRTGNRRAFGAGGAVAAGPIGGPAVVQNGQIVNPPLMSNVADEPYAIEGIGLPLDATWWQGVGANQDLRFFNYLKLKVSPTQGEPWSDVPIPMACYGVHMGLPMRGAWYKPPGGPILMKAGQAMTFDCQNTLARNTQVQIALIGRTAPGYGSLY